MKLASLKNYLPFLNQYHYYACLRSKHLKEFNFKKGNLEKNSSPVFSQNSIRFRMPIHNHSLTSSGLLQLHFLKIPFQLIGLSKVHSNLVYHLELQCFHCFLTPALNQLHFRVENSLLNPNHYEIS